MDTSNYVVKELVGFERRFVKIFAFVFLSSIALFVGAGTGVLASLLDLPADAVIGYVIVLVFLQVIVMLIWFFGVIKYSKCPTCTERLYVTHDQDEWVLACDACQVLWRTKIGKRKRLMLTVKWRLGVGQFGRVWEFSLW